MNLDLWPRDKAICSHVILINKDKQATWSGRFWRGKNYRLFSNLSWKVFVFKSADNYIIDVLEILSLLKVTKIPKIYFKNCREWIASITYVLTPQAQR